MSKKQTEPTKRCFVICPLGDDISLTRRKSDGLLKSVIKPTIEELGYSVTAPHEIDQTGSITNHIMDHILNDELVIANLTELNPNVMYELAVRHASAKPVICLIENGTKIPFDIAQERTIFYENDMHGVEEVKPRLRKMVESINDDPSYNQDNPIYRAIKNFKLQQVAVAGTPEGVLLSKIEELSDDVRRMRNLYDKGFLFTSGAKSIIKVRFIIPEPRVRFEAIENLVPEGAQIMGRGSTPAGGFLIIVHGNERTIEKFSHALDFEKINYVREVL